jgi:hypothetical protein
MKKKSLPRLKNLYLTVSLTFTILVNSHVTSGQTPTNFSGIWVLNSLKSSSMFSNLSATIIIIQDTEANTINLYITSDTTEMKLTKQTKKYILDGKTIIMDDSKERNTQIKADWSSDQKKFAVSELLSVVENGITTKFKSNSVYSLKNYETMIITIDDTPEGKKCIMVFDRAVSLSFPKRLPTK